MLIPIGRRSQTDSAGIEELSLSMDGAFIEMNGACQSSMRDIYAICDVTSEPMLANTAMVQGEMAAISKSIKPL